MLVCLFVYFADYVLDFVVGEEHFEGLDLVAEFGDFGVHFCEEVFLLAFDFGDGVDDFAVEAVACGFADSSGFV